MFERLWPVLVAFVAAHVLIVLLSRLAPKLGWMDRPGGHKHHLGAVPVIGGLAVVLTIAGVLLFRGPWKDDTRALLAGMGALCVLGLIDDRWNLSARARIVLQAAVAFGVLWAGDVWLVDLGDLLPGVDPLHTQWARIPFTVFCVVGVINAFNMIDGMDGLSGSLFLIVGTALLVLMIGRQADSGFAWVLMSALAAMVAFAMWNWPVRWRFGRVFLGDAGTLPLGLLLGVLFVSVSQQPGVLSPAAALWLFAWPLIDTVSVLFRRLASGRSPFSADQRHVHHLLLRAGFTPRETLLIAMVTQAVFAATAVVTARWTGPDWVFALSFLILAGVIHIGLMRVERRRRLFGRPLDERVGAADHV